MNNNTTLIILGICVTILLATMLVCFTVVEYKKIEMGISNTSQIVIKP